MNDIRTAFFAAADAARPVVAVPEVGDRWRDPSALSEMSVGALTAHLVRAVTNVDRYLEAEPPGTDAAPLVSAAAYFLPVTSDLASADNVRVRSSSSEEALLGQRAVVGRMGRAIDRLRARLPSEPEDRLVRAGDQVLLLDQYLRSRLIELTVHIDDLCVSLGRETPPLPGIQVAIGALMEVATLRHGELAVLRALARRERDAVQALRVI
jgi:Mycothiol maleylpyruvate isomerase N-terminal domain